MRSVRKSEKDGYQQRGRGHPRASLHLVVGELSWLPPDTRTRRGVMCRSVASTQSARARWSCLPFTGIDGWIVIAASPQGH